jgi:hypothetical protein
MENHAAEADARAHSKKVLFVVQSVVAAALFLIVLRCSGGETLGAIIWRLSILLCSYFYAAVCVLSASTSKARLFFFFTYAAFLAFAVDAVLSRAAGTAIIYLDSVWMAIVFGHALAGGTSASQKAERWAFQENDLEGDLVLLPFLLVVVAAFALVPGCIMAGGNYAPGVVVAFLPILLCFYLTTSIICQGPLRAIAVILGVERDSARVPVWSLILPLMLYMFSSLLLGEVGAAVLLWICVLAVAVLLGYSIRLEASSACDNIDGWILVEVPLPILNKYN